MNGRYENYMTNVYNSNGNMGSRYDGGHYDYFYQSTFLEKALQKYSKWVMSKYDANNDTQLDTNEAQKLWDDVISYDYSGQLVGQVNETAKWLKAFDKNKDGKLSYKELFKAL